MRDRLLLIGAGTLAVSGQIALFVALVVPPKPGAVASRAERQSTHVVDLTASTVATSKANPAQLPLQFTGHRWRVMCVATTDSCQCRSVSNATIVVDDRTCRRAARTGYILTQR
jgi:hypothetical protein